MAKTYTEEQLNTFDKATLIQLLLMQQSQLQEIDKKLQLLLEQEKSACPRQKSINFIKVL